MRAGYWSFSGAWQYGLILLDPRVPAALVWWLLEAAFLILVLYPLAIWISERLPATARCLPFAAAALAIGLGTRGVVGPLIVRAATAAPAVIRWPGAGTIESWLGHPFTARWLVVLTESWWLLPFLCLAVWLAGPDRRKRCAGRCLLAAYALLQPLGASYLLTAGGPHGATMDLQLLAFREGWGRQEFGYASALAVILSAAAIPLLWPLQWLVTPRDPAENLPVSPRHEGRCGWLVVAGVMVLPLLPALFRGNASLPGLFSGAPAAGLALLLSGLAACWTGTAGVALGSALASVKEYHPRLGLAYVGLAFPLLVLVLPLLRPWGYATGAPELAVLLIGQATAPYLGLATLTAILALRAGISTSGAVRLTFAVVAWATWTDLAMPVLLSQSAHRFIPLQGWITWDLAGELRSSALSVPGWPLAWAGGVILAWLAAYCLLTGGRTSNAADAAG